MKKGESTRQQKGKPIPIHVQDQVVDEIRGLIKNGYLGRATEITEERTPAVISMTKDKLVKNCTRLKNIEESNNKEKRPDAKHGRIEIKNIAQDIGRRGRRDLVNKIGFRFRLRPNQITRSYEKPVQF